MNFRLRKFYDAGANENGGGADLTNEGSETLTDNITESTSTEIKDVPSQILSDEELKNFGFDSPEHLKTFLQEQKVAKVSDDDKKAEADLDKANFIKFSTENKLLNPDEYREYENLKSQPDKDLVYKNFKEEYKTDHPEITDEKELEEAAQEDFNYEYKLNSESESVKKKAEAKIAKEASYLRSPYESKVTTAQEQFKVEKNIREAYPKFEKFITDAVVRNTPDKLVAYKHKEGDSEIEIDIPLTKADREAIEKTFKTPKTFSLFSNGKPEEIQAAIDNKIQGWLFQNKKSEIVSKGIEIGKGLGTKEGSNIGANNPFAIKQGSAATKGGEETLEESNARIAQSRKQYNQGRG